MAVALFVNDLHLFDDGAFARLTGTEKQQFHFLKPYGRMKKEREREENEQGQGRKHGYGLPKSRAGGQGPYLRSLDHLGNSNVVKKKNH